MAISVILSVGYDPVVLETRSSVLRIAGYVVESVASITHALSAFWIRISIWCSSAIPFRCRIETGSRAPFEPRVLTCP